MRADLLLTKLGYARSREAAKKLIEQGFVLIDGAVISKPSKDLDENAEYNITLTEKPKYVSRGGYKLEGILDESGIDPKGKICIDIGSSTGGFTDCLLQRGAAHVYCVDSGSGQLADELRNDKRTTVLEKTNARTLSSAEISAPADIIVMDVSFISQTLLHGKVSEFLKDDGVFLSLIKPQFELTKSKIGKGGIVKSKNDRHLAAERVCLSMLEYRMYPHLLIDSKIKGGDGNHEYTAIFKKQENITFDLKKTIDLLS